MTLTITDCITERVTPGFFPTGVALPPIKIITESQ